MKKNNKPLDMEDKGCGAVSAEHGAFDAWPGERFWSRFDSHMESFIVHCWRQTIRNRVIILCHPGSPLVPHISRRISGIARDSGLCAASSAQVASVSDSGSDEACVRELAAEDRRVLLVDDAHEDVLVAALESVLSDPDAALVIWPIDVAEAYRSVADDPDPEAYVRRMIGRLSRVTTRHGFIVIDTHSSQVSEADQAWLETNRSNMDADDPVAGRRLGANDIVAIAAADGVLPKAGCSHVYRPDHDSTVCGLHWFERRDYAIRQPRPEDLDTLLELEQRCWSEGRRSTAAAIDDRIAAYPNGQCLLVFDNRIAGVIYSQRITDKQLLYGRTSCDIGALHDPEGPIAQLIAVSILPEMQCHGLGDQLLEYMLQYCAAMNGVNRLVAVSLCKDYPRHSSIPMENYIRLRDAQGMLVDPILRLHEAHGAVIAGLVPGYRPADRDNLGNGVLVEYDIHNRSPARLRTIAAARVPHESARDMDLVSIEALVDEAVRSLLREDRRRGFTRDSSLMGAGMDSLDLMRLRIRISERLGLDIQPTFFFRYATVAEIAKALFGMSAETANHQEAESGPSSPIWKRHEGVESRQADVSPSITAEHARGAVAIVGMACRFPGRADSIEAFWSLLSEGRDGVGPMPPARPDSAQFSRTARLASDQGGFLDNVDGFDAHFFGISPREAMLLDPQQRLLLEVGYEALESAGIAPDSLKGTSSGVFVGMFTHDYELLQVKRNSDGDYDHYYATGNANSVAAGRIAYVFGLQGPAMTVDTACSSSLVAVHQACQSVRNGESSLAIAAGVNLILSPEASIAFSKAGMLSPDGRCKTFDASANGYVRGEGCGVVILKSLERAQADGDNIMAVIRGTAVNQDGASNGLTAPNQSAQEAVIRSALSAANVRPEQISYVEAHGTGTPLGDPIEFQALASVFGDSRSSTAPLCLGSVKTNIGHTEAAAGIAGLLKVVLALQHRYLPPHLNFREINPHIDLGVIPAVVPATGLEWTAGDDPEAHRFAGVSSFGFSGTNAHVIVQEAERPVAGTQPGFRAGMLLCVSAKTETARAKAAQRLAEHVDGLPEDRLADICFTAAVGRNHFRERACIAVSDKAQTVACLRALASGSMPPGVFTGSVSPSKTLRIAFLFTGQGSQSVGMARELYESHAEFRNTLEACESVFREYLARPLLDVLFTGSDEDSELHQTAYTQPALFAVELALARLWISWGVIPSVVMGHSVGEYVAACVAGVMSLEDGCRLIAERARLMQSLPPGGAMAAVFAPAETVEEALAPHRDRVSIAAINGPAHTVISGELDTVLAVCERLSGNGIEYRRLQVSHAFHSPLMEPMLASFDRAARSVAFSPPLIGCISNVTGAPIGEEITDPGYWVRHVRSPVQFAASIKHLDRLGVDVFLEIGPKPVLTGMGRRCCTDSKAQWLASLNGGEADWDTLLRSLAILFTTGVAVDWARFYSTGRYTRVELPTYPFERQSYWLPKQLPQESARHRSGRDGRGHPLLGSPLASALKEMQFESRISAEDPAYLADHRVFGETIMPATAYLEMALAASRHVNASGDWLIGRCEFHSALCLTPHVGRIMQTIISPHEGDRAFDFQIYSSSPADAQPKPTWRLHARGELRLQARAEIQFLDLDKLRAAFVTDADMESFYAGLEARGYGYGPAFRAIRRLWRTDREVVAEIELPEAIRAVDAYTVHPVLLDACLQAALALTGDGTLVPVAIESAKLSPIGARCVWARVESLSNTADSGDELIVKLTVIEPDGRVVADVQGLRFAVTTPDALLRIENQPQDRLFYAPRWQEQGMEDASCPSRSLMPPHELGQRLVRYIEDRGSLSCLDPEAGVLDALESLSAAYVLDALQQLGQSFVAGESFGSEESASRLLIAVEHRRQYGRLLEMLEERGFLSGDGTRWTVVRSASDDSPERLLTRLGEHFPMARREFELVGRCGAKLAEILRGQSDVLGLLFPDGKLDEAAAFYREASTFKAVNELLAEAVAVTVRDLPAGFSGKRPLRVLELGAGTGGLTAHVLPCLSGLHVEYEFTDLSNLFLNSARERFSEYGFVDYGILNIEETPSSQGYRNHGYDLIVAANVLHATRDMAQTLGHVRQLLAPGGLLLLLEGTGKRNWIDLIFGLAEGWWRFTDHTLRPAHPLLSDEQWKDCLVRQGFGTVVSVCPESHAKRMLFRQSVVIAQAPIGPDGRVDAAGHWLVFADAGGRGGRMAAQLAAAGAQVSTVAAAGSYHRQDAHTFGIRMDRADDYARVFSELRTAGRALRGVVYLWGLDLDDPERLTHEGVAGLAGPGHGGLLHTVKALLNAELAEPVRLWLVTAGAQRVDAGDSVHGIAQSPLWGVAKVITLEHPELDCTCIDLDTDDEPRSIDLVCKTLLANDDEEHIAIRRGRLWVERLERLDRSDGPPDDRQTSCLEIIRRGTLDDLRLSRLVRRPPAAGEIEIRVHASGLNFRDVLNVLGRYPGDPGPLGDECAGMVVAVGEGVLDFAIGDRVMAMPAGSFADYVTVDAALAARLPDGLEYAAAATIPIAFITAWHVLHRLAGIKAGDRVLIHAASGGVGQAAIQLARLAGAEVFGTASPAKWDVLERLGVRHIMNSRTLDFAGEVMARTGGQGVDIVLNCLSGDFIPRSLSVLRDNGRFLEIGKTGIWTPEQVMAMKPGAAYFVVDLLEIRRNQPELIRSMLGQLATRLKNGELQPLPLTRFALDQATDAFRFMQQASHTGKIVITHDADKSEKPQIRADASYLITGGLGGLGLLFARWLIERGARHLVLLGRRGPDADAQRRIADLEAQGATVIVENADVRDAERLRRIIGDCRERGAPLRGLIHAVGILDDGAIIQQTPERFETVMAPKIEGVWNLHRLTQGSPLDFFFLFSSMASLLGTPGQANHAAANAFLDRLAHYRRARGLPACSINWGAWAEIGVAAREGVGQQWIERGIDPLSPQAGVRAFTELFDEAPAQVGVAPIDWPVYLRQFDGRVPPFYSEFTGTDAAWKRPDAHADESALPIEQVQEAIQHGRSSELKDYLRRQVCRVLRLDAAYRLEADHSLTELGLDSLTGIELRNRINTDLGIQLSLKKFFDGASLTRWSDSILELSTIRRMSSAADIEEDSGYEEVTL